MSTTRKVTSSNGGHSGRTLRSDSRDSGGCLETKDTVRPKALHGAAKRKPSNLTRSSGGHDSRPKVHAQRKFAQGHGSAASSPVKVVRPSPTTFLGQSSSSGRGSEDLTPTKTGDRPKTEDFLTFLCLRGTNMLPPELDFFNKASMMQGNSSDEESSETSNDKPKPVSGGVAKKTVRPKEVRKQKKEECSSAVQALRKKYADQRLAKTVVSKALPTVQTRRTRSQEAKPSQRSTNRGGPCGSKGPSTRSRSTTAKGRALVEVRKPSAAALVAKRKTRMATLTAASNRVSRMLTRLTPRGTSKTAFIRKSKQASQGGRALRPRDLSESSEEDDSEANSESPAKRRRRCRKLRKSDEENSESDADEESSSRDSSKMTRPRVGEANTARHQLRKRDNRSASRDSSVSKESERGATRNSMRARLTRVSLAQRVSSDDANDKLAGSSKETTPSGRGGTRKKSHDSDDKKQRKESLEKRKSKQSIKQLQDMLLEEAKKNIVGKTPPNESENQENDEKFTISQKTGYIQVKGRNSTDQGEDVTVIATVSTASSTHNPTMTTPAALVGPCGRRLSKNSDRMPTPPRKILPKPDLDHGSQTSAQLPLGVIAASKAVVTQGNVCGVITSTAMSRMPVLSSSLSTSLSNQQVPISQHVMITASNHSQGHDMTSTTSSMGMSHHGAGPGVLMSSGSHLRMPMQMAGPVHMPLRHTSSNQFPLINQQMGGIPIATGVPLQIQGMQQQAMQTIIRQPFGYAQPIQFAQQRPHLAAPSLSSSNAISSQVPPTLAPQGMLGEQTGGRFAYQPSPSHSNTPTQGMKGFPPHMAKLPHPNAFPEQKPIETATSKSNEKPKPIFSKGQERKSKGNSFKVENEASPYAFDEESGPSVPFHRTPKGGQSKQQQIESNKSKAKKCEESEFDSGNIPLPEELANQLAAQAKREGNVGNSEMTYFIPLQTSSGQSFGVSVKLGTEGPAGPNQKVIMKAKLVTQPSDTPSGAKTIDVNSLKEQDGNKKTLPKSNARLPMACASPTKVDLESDSDISQPGTSKGNLPSPDSAKKRLKHLQSKDENETCLGMVEVLQRFPKLGQHAHLVEAPVYAPSEKEFKDPMKYIECIRQEAEQFGICKIIPPKSFKPECNVDDDMRFTAYNQVTQKLMHRWGTNTKEMAAIRKYLETQNITIKPHPAVGGVELDLPALYHAVQSFGGLTEVIQRKRWGKIADYLRIPKGTQDRGNKLDDIYCKYLLPYDTLSTVEREELLRLVEEEHDEQVKKRMEKSETDRDSDDDEEEEESDDEDYECVVKGKSTSLSAFFRVARNVMGTLFKNGDPDTKEVEEEFWRVVMERDSHVLVQQGSIDCGTEGYGFPTSKASSCGRHPWNLKILSNNPRSILRCMGPVMGVTVPTLNVGMVYTSACWYRDPHGLPWVDYLHTGAPKIWYSVPDSHSIAFYTAMKQLVPTLTRKKKIWLPADTAMVPPNLLVKHGVPVCRIVQEPGQFIVVFPKTFTSSISTGYSLSESVFYAPKDYLGFAENEFQAIRESGEPMMFPMPKLLLTIAQDEMSTKETLRLVKPFLERIRDNEYVKRTMLADLGVKNTERINIKVKKGEQEDEYECEVCSENLYVSYVCDVKEDTYFCKEHAIEYLQDRKTTQRKHCKILYTHSKEEISSIIKSLNKRLDDSSDDSSSSDDEIEIKRAVDKRGTSGHVNPVIHIPRASSTASFASSSSLISPGSTASSTVSKPRKKKSEEVKAPTTKCTPKPEARPLKRKSAKEDSDSDKPIKRGRANRRDQGDNVKTRKTNVRKAAQDKGGNLAVEYLDMLLSESDEVSDEDSGSEDSSDESWK